MGTQWLFDPFGVLLCYLKERQRCHNAIHDALFNASVELASLHILKLIVAGVRTAQGPDILDTKSDNSSSSQQLAQICYYCGNSGVAGREENTQNDTKCRNCIYWWWRVMCMGSRGCESVITWLQDI